MANGRVKQLLVGGRHGRRLGKAGWGHDRFLQWVARNCPLAITGRFLQIRRHNAREPLPPSLLIMACFFIVLILWVFSVCLHEFGHAWVALKGGDDSVREKGYLTLNPLRYTHPIYSIALPVVFLVLGGIGLPGGAVYIDRSRLRSPVWDTLVSLGGPAANILIIFVIALLFKLGLIPTDRGQVGGIAMAFVLQLQISALIFNLLPVPPLDGFQAIAPWLPWDVREKLYGLSNVAFFAVFIIMAYSRPVNLAFWSLVFTISDFLGVPPQWGIDGYYEFKFWKH